MNPHELLQARLEVAKWLLDTLNEYSDEDLKKTIYFSHVVTKGHKIAYQRYYGFTEVDSIYNHNLDKNEKTFPRH